MHTPDTPIWKPHVVAATVVERDGRFLFVEEDIDGARVLNQPAGHLDPGETLIAAAVRETLEETAWHISVTSLVGVYLLETEIPGKSFLRFCFAAIPERHEPARPLDKEIVATHWLTPGELATTAIRHRSPLVARAVEDYLAGHRHPLTLLHASFRD